MATGKQFGADTPNPDVGTPEVYVVDSRVVACDGGDVSGHPRVWLRIVHEQTFCPWCSRIFRMNPDAVEDLGH